jgi:carbon monoxide dehydrogenase subunit G
MRQSGEYRIQAPREAVWRALNDPGVLARSIEGCESMTQVGEGAFQASVRARIGPVSALFTGDIAIADADPPNGYTLQGAVKGGPAGFGKGSAKVTLTQDGPATILRYDVDGSVGGKLAQVGQRLIDGAARKMADDFFAKFGEIVAPGGSDMLAAAPAPSRGALPLGWILAAVGLAVAALMAFLLTR